MKVIKPITITDSNLTSSSIPEPDASVGEIEWTAGTYNLGDQRILTTTHKVYEVVADPSTSDDPETGVAANPPTWVEVGPTNRYAMFDNKNSSQSTDTTSLDVTITPATLVNSIAGFNITGAETINVKVNDGVSDIYDRDIAMVDNSSRVNWYEFFFSPVVNITRFILLDLPPVIGSDIIVTTTGTSVGFGNLVTGEGISLGTTLYGTSVQGLDFSIREDDGFGGFKVTRRRTADLMDYDCFIDTVKMPYVKNQLKALSQKETVWVGNPDDINDGTATFGYHNNYQINLTGPQVSDMTIQVQELI